jgi:hypothetical protein
MSSSPPVVSSSPLGLFDCLVSSLPSAFQYAFSPSQRLAACSALASLEPNSTIQAPTNPCTPPSLAPADSQAQAQAQLIAQHPSLALSCRLQLLALLLDQALAAGQNEAAQSAAKWCLTLIKSSGEGAGQSGNARVRATGLGKKENQKPNQGQHQRLGQVNAELRGCDLNRVEDPIKREDCDRAQHKRQSAAEERGTQHSCERLGEKHTEKHTDHRDSHTQTQTQTASPHEGQTPSQGEQDRAEHALTIRTAILLLHLLLNHGQLELYHLFSRVLSNCLEGLHSCPAIQPLARRELSLLSRRAVLVHRLANAEIALPKPFSVNELLRYRIQHCRAYLRCRGLVLKSSGPEGQYFPPPPMSEEEIEAAEDMNRIEDALGIGADTCSLLVGSEPHGELELPKLLTAILADTFVPSEGIPRGEGQSSRCGLYDWLFRVRKLAQSVQLSVQDRTVVCFLESLIFYRLGQPDLSRSKLAPLVSVLSQLEPGLGIGLRLRLDWPQSICFLAAVALLCRAQRPPLLKEAQAVGSLITERCSIVAGLEPLRHWALKEAGAGMASPPEYDQEPEDVLLPLSPLISSYLPFVSPLPSVPAAFGPSHSSPFCLPLSLPLSLPLASSPSLVRLSFLSRTHWIGLVPRLAFEHGHWILVEDSAGNIEQLRAELMTAYGYAYELQTKRTTHQAVLLISSRLSSSELQSLRLSCRQLHSGLDPLRFTRLLIDVISIHFCRPYKLQPFQFVAESISVERPFHSLLHGIRQAKLAADIVTAINRREDIPCCQELREYVQRHRHRGDRGGQMQARVPSQDRLDGEGSGSGSDSGSSSSSPSSPVQSRLPLRGEPAAELDSSFLRKIEFVSAFQRSGREGEQGFDPRPQSEYRHFIRTEAEFFRQAASLTPLFSSAGEIAEFSAAFHAGHVKFAPNVPLSQLLFAAHTLDLYRFVDGPSHKFEHHLMVCLNDGKDTKLIQLLSDRSLRYLRSTGPISLDFGNNTIVQPWAYMKLPFWNMHDDRDLLARTLVDIQQDQSWLQHRSS